MSDKCIVNPERDCLGLIKAKELEEDLRDLREHNEKSHKEYFDRLASLESHNMVQDANYGHILERLAGIAEQLTNLGTRLVNIEYKPAKRWESVTEKVLLTVVGAIVGYFLVKVGL